MTNSLVPRTLAVAGCAVFAMVAMAAVPSLKGTPEAAGQTGLKVRTFAGAQMMPALTPKSQRWRYRQGEETWTEEHYDVREIWMGHECSCRWKDRKGNQLALATPTAFCPDLADSHAKREDIDAKMAEDAAAFAEPSDETFVRWAAEFSNAKLETSALAPLTVPSLSAVRLVDFGGSSRIAAFFKTKTGPWRYVEFSLAQGSSPKDREALMKTFLKGIVEDKARSGGAGDRGGIVTEGRWKTFPAKDGYRFKTDLSLSQGTAFIKNAGRLMAAMQAAYRRYVPPQKEIGISTVRVFATREGYNEYMRGATGESGERSIGLWSPSHDELLILDMGNSAREETLKTMRHEAFHQYLSYATGRARHAVWFNEGHACFFENVSYDAKRNYVRVWDDPNDRRPAAVAQDPGRFARLFLDIRLLDHEAFYAGTLREVNDRYAAAWAAVYFLEKGAPAFAEFAAYRGVLPAYLKAIADGKSPDEATTIAWEPVANRDFAADFSKFWNKRTGARKYEPPAK